MKFLIVVALAVACTHADVSHVLRDEAAATILRSDTEVNPENFQYAYETSNGIFSSASGVVKNPNTDAAAQQVNGQYKYTGPDGVTYEVTYTADENGFQPQGAHLPVSPPIPEPIARALAYIAAHPQPEDKYVSRAVPVPVAPVAVATASAFGKPAKPFRRF